jgi:hypothetical protein
VDEVLSKYKDFAQYGKLRFVMSEFTGEKERVFYVDNMRFEWATDLSASGEEA